MSDMVFTIDDVLSLLDEVEPQRGGRAYATCVASLREGPLAELYRQIEQMAADAGIDRNRPGWERQAVAHHRALDQLLTLLRERHATQAFGDSRTPLDYTLLRNICFARSERGEANELGLTYIGLELAMVMRFQRSPAVLEALQDLETAIHKLAEAYAGPGGEGRARGEVARALNARAIQEIERASRYGAPLRSGPPVAR